MPPQAPPPHNPQAPAKPPHAGVARKTLLAILFLIGSIGLIVTYSANNSVTGTSNSITSNASAASTAVSFLLAILGGIFQDDCNALLQPLDQPLYHFYVSLGMVRRHQRKIVATVGIIALIVTVSSILYIIPGVIHDTIFDFVCVQNYTIVHSWCGNGVDMTQIDSGGGNLLFVGLNDGSIDEPFNQADSDTTEAGIEHAIFAENQRISGSHITIIVVTTLSRTLVDSALSASVGLDDLRGVYLAQRDYNAKHTLKLRVLVANIGIKASAAKGAAIVAKKIILYERSDTTFMGVVGFPFSGGAQVALPYLQKEHIPLISPSASSTNLNNVSYFHRMVSNDAAQSDDTVKFISSYFGGQTTTIAIFSDPHDSYSSSLGASMNDSIQKIPNVHVVPISYTSGNEASIKTALMNANEKGANLFFMAGYADDLNTLKTDMQQQHIQTAIMGGEALYELGAYNNGNYANLYFSTYASPDEIYPYDGQSNAGGFAKEYADAFDPTHGHCGQYGYARPGPHAMLSYDAVNTFLAAFNATSGPKTPDSINQNLLYIQLSGVSGFLTFKGGSDPVDREMLVLHVDASGHTIVIERYHSLPKAEPVANVPCV